MTNRAIFLDRDGTIVEDMGYARSADQMQLLPGAAEAIREFRQRGYLVVLITNQSGIGRGYFSEQDLASMHGKIREDLAAYGTALDAVYFCPHLPAEHPDCPEPCDCRKSRPGMLLRAAQDLDIDLSKSFMVGDKPSDVNAGKAAGCRTGIVGSEDEDWGADFVLQDLRELVPHLSCDA